jgi:hypothetical protein
MHEPPIGAVLLPHCGQGASPIGNGRSPTRQLPFSAYPYTSSADLQVGCLVGLLARTRTLSAWTSPVRPLWRAALLEHAICGKALGQRRRTPLAWRVLPDALFRLYDGKTSWRAAELPEFIGQVPEIPRYNFRGTHIPSFVHLISNRISDFPLDLMHGRRRLVIASRLPLSR